MNGGRNREEGEVAVMPPGCSALHRALSECHRRVPDPRLREVTCRHLNRSLAECVLSAACPEECEAVRSLCSSAGISMKRAQCQRAKLSLSRCLSSLQDN